MPWRNGLGVTTEIARWPAEGDTFDWRVSVAGVATSGPFSVFPGIERVLVVLDGDGLRLAHAGQADVTLGPLQPYTFSGDGATEGTLLGGPVRDFNVMARRAMLQPRVTVLRPEPSVDVPLSPAVTLLYCVQGTAAGSLPGHEVTLAAGDTFSVTGEEPGAMSVLSLDSGTTLLLVSVVPVTPLGDP